PAIPKQLQHPCPAAGSTWASISECKASLESNVPFGVLKRLIINECFFNGICLQVVIVGALTQSFQQRKADPALTVLLIIAHGGNNGPETLLFQRISRKHRPQVSNHLCQLRLA